MPKKINVTDTQNSDLYLIHLKERSKDGIIITLPSCITPNPAILYKVLPTTPNENLQKNFKFNYLLTSSIGQ